MSQSVLIVDDELDIQSSLSLALRDEGFHVLVATLPEEALRILAKEVIDVALFDVWFPKGDGIELLKETRERFPRVLPIMMSGHGTIELALSAIRLGAYDFLEKPLELEKVLVLLKNALETRDLRNENERLNKLLFEKGQMIGSSPALQQLKSQIQRAAISSTPLTLIGEVGAGKSLCARLLHDMSPRKIHPFVIWSPLSYQENTIEESLFGTEQIEQASPQRREGTLEAVREGTLVLTDIEKIPLHLQNRIAEVMKNGFFLRRGGKQNIPFKGRWVLSNYRPLSETQKFSKLSEEFYRFVQGLEIRVPPLRERREDIVEIFEFFIAKTSADQGINQPTVASDLNHWLHDYDWPGNIRELKNLAERTLMLSDPEKSTISILDLPDEIQNFTLQSEDFSNGNPVVVEDPDGPLRKLRAEFEKSIIVQRLQKQSGNVTRTADSLGIERAHLHRKMRQYGIHSGKDAV